MSSSFRLTILQVKLTTSYTGLSILRSVSLYAHGHNSGEICGLYIWKRSLPFWISKCQPCQCILEPPLHTSHITCGICEHGCAGNPVFPGHLQLRNRLLSCSSAVRHVRPGLPSITHCMRYDICALPRKLGHHGYDSGGYRGLDIMSPLPQGHGWTTSPDWYLGHADAIKPY